MNSASIVAFICIFIPATIGMLCIMMSFLYDKEPTVVYTEHRKEFSKKEYQISSSVPVLYSNSFDLNNLTDIDDDESASVIIEDSPI